MNEQLSVPSGGPPPNRCVIVVDKDLPAGHLANAAAVIAVTVGQRHPQLVGGPLVDGSGASHPGLIAIGVTVLGASREELSSLRQQGLAADCDIVDFPVEGQQTTDYQAFQETVSQVPPENLSYLGIGLIGQKKAIRKIVGHLNLVGA